MLAFKASRGYLSRLRASFAVHVVGAEAEALKWDLDPVIRARRYLALMHLDDVRTDLIVLAMHTVAVLHTIFPM